jgi:hypothetical protein
MGQQLPKHLPIVPKNDACNVGQMAYSAPSERLRQAQMRRTVENAHWSDTRDWLTDTRLGPVFRDRAADLREGGLHAL